MATAENHAANTWPWSSQMFGSEDAANRVTRLQPAKLIRNPSPSQATRSPPATAPKPAKPALKPQATHASPSKPTGVSAMIAALNSAGQEGKLAGTLPSKPSRAPQPPPRPKPATPHNTARAVETKDPATVQRVQPVVTSDPVSPPRPPLCDRALLAAGGNQSMGTQVATSAPADPKPSPKPGQAVPFRSASVSTFESSFESDRQETGRLSPDRAPKPKQRPNSTSIASTASLARSPAIAVGKDPGGHAVQHVQRPAPAAEGMSVKPIALPKTGCLSIAKTPTGNLAKLTRANSLGQAGNTGPWSSQEFRSEDAAKRVTRRQPAQFIRNPLPSPSQATQSPPATGPKPKPVVEPQATHASSSKPTSVSTRKVALNSADQEGKLARTQPLKSSRAPQPPTRPTPATPHNTARTVETKDPATVHRVQPVMTSAPVSPPRPPLPDRALLATGDNQPVGTEAATSGPADPKPSPKPGQAVPFRSASVFTFESSFESDRYETGRLSPDRAPKPKQRPNSTSIASTASLARSPAIAVGKDPGGHAVQHEQRSVRTAEGISAKHIALPKTGCLSIAKTPTGDSATLTRANSLCQADNTGPWSSQEFRSEDAAKRVTRRQPAQFIRNPLPSPSQATQSPPATGPKPKPVVEPQATHASSSRPTSVSARKVALNSADQEGKLAGTQPLKSSRAPQPPTRPTPATPHNTARTVETKDPTTVHRVQPVVTSAPVSPPRPPLPDRALLATGDNQPVGTEAATSGPADPKPSPKPGQAVPFRSASVSTFESSFESDRYETGRLSPDRAPKPKQRPHSTSIASTASLARSPAIAVGKDPGGHAVEHVQRSVRTAEGISAKHIALPKTGCLSIAKTPTGDSATLTRANSLGQADNTGPWSSQEFRSEDAANRVTRRQPAQFIRNPPPSPSQATRSPPATAPKPKRVVEPQATHASPPKPTSVSARMVALNSAGQEGKLAGTQPLKSSRAPQPPTRPTPATPHNTARTVETKDPATVHRVQPVVTSAPVSPPRPPLPDRALLATGDNQPVGTEAATSGPADPKPCPKPGQAVPFRSASVSTFESSFESDRYETVRLTSNQAPKPKPRRNSIADARAASLAINPAIAVGKDPDGHAVQHVQRPAPAAEGMSAKPTALPKTGHFGSRKKATGDSAMPSQPTSPGQAGNTGPCSSQEFRNEDAAKRVTRRQPAQFIRSPLPSPSQATQSPPATAPELKPVVEPQATHTSPSKPGSVSARKVALNSAGQEGKLAGTQPLKSSRAPQPPTRPTPATPHNTASKVETKDPATVHRVQPVVTSDPVSPPRPPLCDRALLAAGGNRPDGTQAATSTPAGPKPSSKPRQAVPSKSASDSTLASSFESDRYETVRLASNQAPEQKPHQKSQAGTRPASLAINQAIAVGKDPDKHAVQHVQRPAPPAETLSAKQTAPSKTGRFWSRKKATGDSATSPRANSHAQAGNTGSLTSQEFRKWFKRLQAMQSRGVIRTACYVKDLLTNTRKKELMGVDYDSAKHIDRLLDMLSHVSPECTKDCTTIVELVKEFSAPERRRVVHTVEDVARMRASQTVLGRRKKPIRLPQPTSPKSVDLLRMQNMGEEKRQAVLTEIDRLASNTIIIDDMKECADEAGKYQGRVTRADGRVEKSPADIHRELSRHPCFISMATGSARDGRSISETKQYLKDTGFIDDHTVITEITEHQMVLGPVTRLAIRDSKRLKFKDERSSIVKIIIDFEYNHKGRPSFVDRVVRNLRALLGDESIHADSVHGESGGTAVFVQMSAKAHARLWEFCKDRSSLLAGQHILEVSTVDGAVVLNFCPTACSDEGITPEDQKCVVDEFSKRFPSLRQDELSVAVADQPDVEHAVIAATKLVFDEDGACLNALPEILGALRKWVDFKAIRIRERGERLKRIRNVVAETPQRVYAVGLYLLAAVFPDGPKAAIINKAHPSTSPFELFDAVTELWCDHYEVMSGKDLHQAVKREIGSGVAKTIEEFCIV
ncbi:mucin-2-like isoform X2 [Sycon ciliatum]|uniref:mucin-2-like isoform X2 n=1 Tax=Sycon ciliatum TaxID=27933 RepID=UPI0031F6E8EA